MGQKKMASRGMAVLLSAALVPTVGVPVAAFADEAADAQASASQSAALQRSNVVDDMLARDGAATASVIKIGDVSYDTLQSAVDAIAAGTASDRTIKLEGDASGNGVVVKSGTDFALDLGGFTYTVDGATVGSAGTETNGFQLLQDSNITIKNGTIKSDKAKILIQNYSNLTLEEVSLIGGASTQYTLSNNNGDVVIGKGANITAGQAGSKVAFDVCGFSSYKSVNVTVAKDAGVIEGAIELSSDNDAALSLAINGGDLSKASIVAASGAEKVSVTKAPDVTLAAPNGYQWIDGALVEVGNNVAIVDGVAYPTIAAAIGSADSSIVSLIADSQEDVVIPEGKTVAIDLAGHKITSVSGNTITNNGILSISDSSSTKTGTIDCVTKGKSALMNNGTVEEISGGIFERSQETDSVGIYSSYYLLENYGKIKTISGGSFHSGDGEVAHLGAIGSLIRNGDTSVKAEIGRITGGEFLNAANIIKNEAGARIGSISGGTFTMDNTVNHWEGGNNVLVNYGEIESLTGGEFKAIGSGIYNPSDQPTRYWRTGLFNEGVIGEISGSFSLVMEGDNNRGIALASNSVTNFKGGTFSVRDTVADPARVSILFNFGKTAVVEMTGGNYSEDPSEYVADGYDVVESDGMWTVSKHVVPTPPTDPEPQPDGDVVVNPDGSTTTTDKETVEGADGTVTETVTETTEGRPDGSTTVKVTETVTDKDGNEKVTVTETNTLADGTSATVVSDGEGAVTKVEAKVPADAEGPVVLPMDPLPAPSDGESAPEVSLDCPEGAEVTVPVVQDGSSSSAGAVLMLRQADGTWRVLPKCALGEDGLTAGLPADAVVKVVDASPSFPDVEGAWYGSDGTADFVGARGVLAGMPQADGTLLFDGDAPTTRAMFVTMLHRLESEPAAGAGGFEDVDGDWFAGAAAWGAQSGVVNGYGDGSVFGGNDPVTREQMAVFAMRYAAWLGLDTSARADLSAFADGAQASGYASEALSWAVAEGVLRGHADGSGRLDPRGGATRAEASAVVMRLVNGMYA